MAFRITFTAALLALFLAGCELTGIVDGGESSRPVHDIEFRLAERQGPAPSDEPRLFFSMHTEKEYPCAGYRIRHAVTQSRDHVVVDVFGVEEPRGICATVVLPASAQSKLLLDPGEYRLTLKKDRDRDTYTLHVAEDRVQVTKDEASWTESKTTLQWRYPRNSFAYYCGTLTEDKFLCADFEAELAELPLAPLDVPDEGEWPYALSSTGHYYDAPAQFYKYPDESTWAAVKQRLSTFTRDHVHGREGVGLWVENWLGDGERSWMVEPE